MNTQTIITYLIGLSGTGKYTIAKQIALHDYKIVDNHLINNPIFSLLDIDSITPIPFAAWQAIVPIRNAVFNFVAQEKTKNYLFTNELLEVGHDRVIYEKVKDLAIQRDSIFIPIKLLISSQERAKRITSLERKNRFKLTIDTRYLDSHTDLITFDHPHMMTLDVTNLSAHEASEKIMQHVVGINSRGSS